MNILIFGGTGFVGRYLVNTLAEDGCNRIVVVSRVPRSANSIFPLARVGQVSICRADILADDEESLFSLFKYADVAINLIDPPLGAKSKELHSINAVIPEKLARLSARFNLKSFITLSTLAAEYKASVFTRSKFNGEQAALAAFDKTIVIRSAPVFGEGDHFINTMVSFHSFFPFVFSVDSDKKIDPIFVGDLAKFISAKVMDLENFDDNRIFEVAGMESFAVDDLWEMINRKSKKRKIIHLSKGLALFFASIMENKLINFILTPISGFLEPVLTKDVVSLFFQPKESFSTTKNSLTSKVVYPVNLSEKIDNLVF